MQEATYTDRRTHCLTVAAAAVTLVAADEALASWSIEESGNASGHKRKAEEPNVAAPVADEEAVFATSSAAVAASGYMPRGLSYALPDVSTVEGA
jgi:hypothetical protein